MSAGLPPAGAFDKIFVEDIRFYGHHGVTEAQQVVGAWFSVDVELTLDLRHACLSDDLRTTVDYSEVTRRVMEIGTKERVHLLERLAALVADGLLREFPAEAVRVRIRKLTPPAEGIPGVPGVELLRRR